MKHFIDLDEYPFFACSAGDRVEVFINGESRGFYHPSVPFWLYNVIVPCLPEEMDNDDLPF